MYLVTTIDTVLREPLDWVATDGNAATATTEFTSDLVTLETLVDWPLMKAERWKTPRRILTGNAGGWRSFWCIDAFPCH